jgi:hypothetical protein
VVVPGSESVRGSDYEKERERGRDRGSEGRETLDFVEDILDTIRYTLYSPLILTTTNSCAPQYFT